MILLLRCYKFFTHKDFPNLIEHGFPECNFLKKVRKMFKKYKILAYLSQSNLITLEDYPDFEGNLG